jgi:hypothetical protein
VTRRKAVLSKMYMMKPRLNSLAWIPSVMSGWNLAPQLRWSMVVAASSCGDVFQRQWLGD